LYSSIEIPVTGSTAGERAAKRGVERVKMRRAIIFMISYRHCMANSLAILFSGAWTGE